jgi:hypothetical protein
MKDLKLLSLWSELVPVCRDPVPTLGLTNELQKFDNLVSALPRECVRLVLDILENTSPTTNNTQFKLCLLLSQELTDFHRIEKLHQLGGLGDQKPSVPLTTMLELYPHGHEMEKFFSFLFSQLLLAKLRVPLVMTRKLAPGNWQSKQTACGPSMLTGRLVQWPLSSRWRRWEQMPPSGAASGSAAADVAAPQRG